MRNLSRFFIVSAILLSDAMCAVVGFNYAEMLWGEKYAGYSAPPSTAFFLAIPFLIGIISCICLAILSRKKASN